MLLLAGFDLALLVHAAKTDRFMPWGYVILMVPGVGGLVYIAFEILPEFLGTAQGQRARARAVKAISPNKDYLRLRDDLSLSDTMANRLALARECLATGRLDEALLHFRVLQSKDQFAEPSVWIACAETLQCLGKPAEALAELDALKARWPDFQSQSGHLLYAILLEESGRLDEALHEYAELSGYFPGAEPRARRADLLSRTGRSAAAQHEAEQLLTWMRRSPKQVRREQRQWIDLAQKIVSAARR
jgi:hypothetical protein